MAAQSIGDEAFRALTYIGMAVLVYITYSIGKKGVEQKPEHNLDIKDLIKRIAAGLGIIIGIAIFAGYINLGTSSECDDSDPIRGTCETTQDYTPSSTERAGTAVYFLTLLGIPYLYGGYSEYKLLKSGKAKEENDAIDHRKAADKKKEEEDWQRYVKENPELFKDPK